eukprot:749847-Hanusia_phi.AAC.1
MSTAIVSCLAQILPYVPFYLLHPCELPCLTETFLYILDIDMLEWSQLDISQSTLGHRWGFVTQFIGNEMFVYGGSIATALDSANKGLYLALLTIAANSCLMTDANLLGDIHSLQLGAVVDLQGSLTNHLAFQMADTLSVFSASSVTMHEDISL